MMLIDFLVSLVQMSCGPKSCQLGAKGRGGCPSGQSCVPIRDGHCFVRSCVGLGECWRSGPPPATPKCHPSSAYQDNSCANITLTFDKDTLPKVSGPERGEEKVKRWSWWWWALGLFFRPPP